MPSDQELMTWLWTLGPNPAVKQKLIDEIGNGNLGIQRLEMIKDEENVKQLLADIRDALQRIEGDCCLIHHTIESILDPEIKTTPLGPPPW